MTAAVVNNDDQRDVIAFLSNPGTFKPAPVNVTRIDTHGAHVFIGAQDVFKIKRAIRYPYMDFSTVAKRHAACAREVEINAPNAPVIYRGLVSITREADGQIALGGSGPTIEWAVHMARFREEDVLENRVSRKPLTREEAKALAGAVFASHVRAHVIQRPPPKASIGAIANDVLAALPQLFKEDDQALISALTDQLTVRITRLLPLLERRAREGHVRRCHGDLHLANIVLLDGKPTLFDAIEFDETLAIVDTLYDLAFLLMDLDHRGQRSTANAVLNYYLWLSQESSDLEALTAMPVFLALRAAIRAMVGAQKVELGRGDLKLPRGYLHLAHSYLHDAEPQLVLIGGLSGSGKSTLAAALAPSIGRAPGALHLRSDLERKALFHADELEKLSEDAYTEEATENVYSLMLSKAETALRAGHSVIADAVHAQPSERAAMASLAERTGSRLHAFWLDAPPKVLIARVAARQNDASDATPQVVERQMAYDLGQLEWTRLDASGPLEETLRTAMSYLHASIDPP